MWLRHPPDAVALSRSRAGSSRGKRSVSVLPWLASVGRRGWSDLSRKTTRPSWRRGRTSGSQPTSDARFERCHQGSGSQSFPGPSSPVIVGDFAGWTNGICRFFRVPPDRIKRATRGARRIQTPDFSKDKRREREGLFLRRSGSPFLRTFCEMFGCGCGNQPCWEICRRRRSGLSFNRRQIPFRFATESSRSRQIVSPGDKRKFAPAAGEQLQAPNANRYSKRRGENRGVKMLEIDVPMASKIARAMRS